RLSDFIYSVLYSVLKNKSTLPEYSLDKFLFPMITFTQPVDVLDVIEITSLLRYGQGGCS
ncbi:MAG TPA: hypothetical protein VEJ22_03315, partial [Nitrospirota bacterium]|nr:hypothetical protein [Nitrospirota bacterium]